MLDVVGLFEARVAEGFRIKVTKDRLWYVTFSRRDSTSNIAKQWQNFTAGSHSFTDALLRANAKAEAASGL